jgi:hypothetical protein
MYAQDRTTIVDRREALRVKLKSLAAEALIIRHEERRTFGSLRESLYRHRMDVVRHEARHSHLAYGFIRGMKYEQMEATCDRSPDWERVRQMLKKYGPKGMVEPSIMSNPVKTIARGPRLPRVRGSDNQHATAV